MSRPALLDKLFQAGEWLFRPELIPLPDLVKTGGGLAVDTKTGKLYVDFSLVPDDQMQAIVLAMVQEGGGLAVDGKGQLYVDFASMPTDKFETMLKSIRVPVWLSSSIDIYVAPNGIDAEGRGLSPDSPFATLSYALTYISTIYNLYLYNANVHLAAGVYEDNYGIRKTTSLPSYASTSGIIQIYGSNRDAPEDTVIGGILNNKNASYQLYDLTCKPADDVSYQMGINCISGSISLYNCIVDISETIVASKGLGALHTEQTGVISIPAGNDARPRGLKIKIGDVGMSSLISAGGGTIQFTADIEIVGNGKLNTALASATNGGLIYSYTSTLAYPGRHPIVSTSGTIEGRKYQTTLNGVINTSGGGADFFPGSESGYTSTGGQYI